MISPVTSLVRKAHALLQPLQEEAQSGATCSQRKYVFRLHAKTPVVMLLVTELDTNDFDVSLPLLAELW